MLLLFKPVGSVEIESQVPGYSFFNGLAETIRSIDQQIFTVRLVLGTDDKRQMLISRFHHIQRNNDFPADQLVEEFIQLMILYLSGIVQFTTLSIALEFGLVLCIIGYRDESFRPE